MISYNSNTAQCMVSGRNADSFPLRPHGPVRSDGSRRSGHDAVLRIANRRGDGPLSTAAPTVRNPALFRGGGLDVEQGYGRHPLSSPLLLPAAEDCSRGEGTVAV